MQIDLYNDKSLDRSPKKNWVEKVGGLPPNVRARARAICRENPGWTLSRCIATAINAVKYSRATGDSKLPGKQNQRGWIVRRHTRAANSWDRKKTKNASMNMANDVKKKKKDDDEKDTPFGKKSSTANKKLKEPAKDPKKKKAMAAKLKKEKNGK